MIVLPPSGGYRLDGSDDGILNPNSEFRRLVAGPSSNGVQSDYSIIIVDKNAAVYRKHFFNQVTIYTN